MLVTNRWQSNIDFPSLEKQMYYQVNGYRQFFGNQHSSKHIILCLAEKEMHKGMEQWIAFGVKIFL